MKKLQVMIGIKLEKERLEQITAVDPRIELADASEHFLQIALISEAHPEVSLDRLCELMKGVEVMYTLQPMTIDVTPVAARVPTLRWIHTALAGADKWVEAKILETGITFTTSRGTPGVTIGEYVIMLMLMMAKHAHLLILNQAKHFWLTYARFPTISELCGQTVGIVGLGGVGRHTAKLAKAFGMRVLAYDPYVSAGEVQDVDYMCKELHQLLTESDFVVIGAPLTKETWHLFGEAEFRVTKRTAHIVNTSRGALIDEVALVKALKEGKLAGAALDVFELEPLPPESELWDMPNVIISPHVSGGSTARWGRTVDLFCENLKRYLAREKLINVYDPDKGF